MGGAAGGFAGPSLCSLETCPCSPNAPLARAVPAARPSCVLPPAARGSLQDASWKCISWSWYRRTRAPGPVASAPGQGPPSEDSVASRAVDRLGRPSGSCVCLCVCLALRQHLAPPRSLSSNPHLPHICKLLFPSHWPFHSYKNLLVEGKQTFM